VISKFCSHVFAVAAIGFAVEMGCKSKVLIFIIYPIVFTLLGIYLSKNYQKVLDKICPEIQTPPLRAKYILHDGKTKSNVLISVDRVLSRLKLEKIDTKKLEPENYPDDWNLFWSFPHQERIKDKVNFRNLKYHQKVNHFPGNYVLVSKSVLATHTNLSYIPKAFLTSDEVQEYAEKHPEKRFVMKLKSNRGVKLVKPSEMNFTITNSIDEYFAQEFLENPLLWNGYKFDFSIFTVITSVDPLRLYIYNKNVNLRFCLKPYDASNASNVDSYVIGTDHIPGMSFESVKKYSDHGYTYKEAFEAFMRDEVKADVDEIWRKVEKLIRDVVMEKEEDFIDKVSEIQSKILNSD
jgi:hypothetical protein